MSRAARRCAEANEIGRIGIRAALHDEGFALVYLRDRAGAPVLQPTADGRKGTVWRCVPRTRADVVDELRSRWGFVLSEHEVGVVFEAMRDAFVGTLREMEAILPPRPRAPRRGTDWTSRIREGYVPQ